jgi:hypothetical protein
MGKYDDISESRLRADLVAFAQLILRLDSEDGVLASPADLQRILGELRQKLFAFEVRRSRLATDPPGELEEAAPRGGRRPREADDPVLRESLKVVREALRRSEEMLREWDGAPPEEDDERE